MCEFVFKGNPLVIMYSAKYALNAKCLEDIDIPLLNPRSMFCLKERKCPLKAKINPHRHRQRHLNGVARLENKLNSPWTTRNVGHVNNKGGQSQ